MLNLGCERLPKLLVLPKIADVHANLYCLEASIDVTFLTEDWRTIFMTYVIDPCIILIPV